MATSPRRLPPASRTHLNCVLVGRRRLSDSFVRITLEGESLRNFELAGADQWFRLFLPKPGQDIPAVMNTDTTLSAAQFILTPRARRPLMRSYTVTSFDHQAVRLEFDILCDGSHSGVGTQWAENANIGSTAIVLDEGRLYNPPQDSRWQILIGDSSAIPALGGIVKNTDPAVTTHVVILGDQGTQSHPMMSHWTDDPHTERGPKVSCVSLQGRSYPADHTAPNPRTVPYGSAEFTTSITTAIRAAIEPELDLDTPGYVYIAGEQSMVKSVRRLCVNDLNIPKSRITFTGYWRADKSADAL